MSDVSRTRINPITEYDRRAIREELAELLKTAQFANSKRYPALLIYVVEKTLAGKAEELKERILGIEVFHRLSDYDTNNDTVVRVAAGEVRKRLAVIYHESEWAHPIHITLPAGSYVPEFFRMSPQAELSPFALLPVSEQEPVQPLTVDAPPLSAPLILPAPWWRRRELVTAPAVILFLLLLAGSVALVRGATRKSSLDRFWQPVRSSSARAIICPGALVRSATTPSGMTLASRNDDYPFTSIASALSLTDVVRLFTQDHTDFVVQPASTTSLADMREHPVVLIAAYSNEWTGRLQDDLRYRFAPEPAREIVDATNPSKTWKRPASLPLNEEDDFGIVARFHSKLTDNTVVLIAGIGKNATEAAAKFLTTPRYMDLLNDESKSWGSKNVEVVLKVKVIDGKNGAPTVEAVYVW